MVSKHRWGCSSLLISFLLDGNALAEDVRNALGTFDWRQLRNMFDLFNQMIEMMNQLRRGLPPNVIITDSNCFTCSAGDKLQQDVRKWLSPPDPWKNHNIARESQHVGTTTWFTQGGMFSEWKSSGWSSLLWIH